MAKTLLFYRHFVDPKVAASSFEIRINPKRPSKFYTEVF